MAASDAGKPAGRLSHADRWKRRKAMAKAARTASVEEVAHQFQVSINTVLNAVRENGGAK